MSTSGLSIKALSAFTYLTRLYLDLIDVDEFAGVLGDLYLPNLTHLYMPLVYGSDIQDNDTSGAKVQPVCALLDRHRETLQEFHLLNAANDRQHVRGLLWRVDDWLRIEEVRLDSVYTDCHHNVIEPGLEWTRTSDFLGADGRDHWGRNLRRARLDRFNLLGVHTGIMFDYVWQKLRVLVLNPGLAWDDALFPDPNDRLSPRIQELGRLQALGCRQQPSSGNCAELLMAQKIVRSLRSKSICRIISIRNFRFWVQRPRQVVWHLRDALQDPVQSQAIRQLVDPLDWAFLSERASRDSVRGSGIATFRRYQQEESSPETPILTAQESFIARMDRLLDGGSVTDLSRLTTTERRVILSQILVASEPLWIYEEGVIEEVDVSLPEDATLLLDGSLTQDDQLSLEAKEVYYKENVFQMSLHCLTEFLYAHQPRGGKDFVRRMIISVSASSDSWDDMDDLQQLLDCPQIEKVTVRVIGRRLKRDRALARGYSVLKQLRNKLGTSLTIQQSS